VKIEQSLPGHYEQDKAIVIDALRHDCARKKDFVGAYVASHPETRGKLDVELDSGSYQGYEYAVCAENVAGMSGTLGQVQIFLPHGEMIVTAYLLNQKDAQLKTAEAVLAARRAFIEGYIGFLAGGSR
jgi:hypothetical protein